MADQTTLKTIFERPVDRSIEGVIKADDEASLRIEMDEYVLTGELVKRLEAFLDAYRNYDVANGVWISGFFGSGKSHLLKMLALVLENRLIDGVPAVNYMLPKCGDNEILRTDLKLAAAIPSRSILFNIDQKADLISKIETDALLGVFVKVFDEMCGYYGKQGHIAQFERDLDSKGLYEPFKAAFLCHAGRPWKDGREQVILESRHIAGAYAEVSGEQEAESVGILDKYRSQYRVSIEDFAEKVREYVEKQPDGFRLNFFVDEVGQYIANHTKLMTNLQTIAESLATKCRGRAWLIVTAQEDMENVVDEMTRQQSHDFSKIQARFATRMKLTSADVAEVIEKRLLKKTDDGIRLLEETYRVESNNFKTLFDFVDGSVSYRNFRDRDHFIQSYPFIPYQFTLFQSAIVNLSKHGAFEGKHSSVGERSMLGVFQQVAIKIGDYRMGQLATFDLMFEGIQTALKSNIQRSILKAQKHLESPFALRLLKALFLVKYVKDFKSTVRNLSVLMRESFGQDLTALRRDVQEALNVLEHQTYIQRNGDLYEYLTDEEKDVEQEIKGTDVEVADVAAELDKFIFDSILKSPKIRCEETGQDYPYSRRIDERLFRREYELSIRVISPFNENVGDESVLKMQNLGKDELMVVMQSDDRIMFDLLMYLKTDKYVRQNLSTTQQENVRRILNDKNDQNTSRYEDLKLRIRTSLGDATLIVGGSVIDVPSKEAQERIFLGFNQLLARVYSNLKMLRGTSYKETDIASCLKPDTVGLAGIEDDRVPESELEVFAWVQANARTSMRITVKDLIQRFESKPYGWNYAAILCTLAKLCARGKIEVRSDSNSLEEKELERVLRNSPGHSNLVLEPQVDFTAAQIRNLKRFYEEFFDAPPTVAEAKPLAIETNLALQKLTTSLEQYVLLTTNYPFLDVLRSAIAKLRPCTGKPYAWYLTDFHSVTDELLALKESVIDPVIKFMKGQQKAIFDAAADFLIRQDANLSYVEGDEASLISDVLKDSGCFRGNQMQVVKGLLDTLKARVATQVAEHVKKARARVDVLKKGLSELPEFETLSAVEQAQFLEKFDQLSNSIGRNQLIAVIGDLVRQFEEHEYSSLLSDVIDSAEPEPEVGTEDTQTAKPVAPKVRIEYLPVGSVKVSFGKSWLAEESDVDAYVETLRKALLVEISKGKRIQIK